MPKMEHLYSKMKNGTTVLKKNHTFQEHPNYTFLLMECFKQALKSWMGSLSTQLSCAQPEQTQEAHP